LEAWRKAGSPLGNHGWSHMNLNQHAIEEFESDVSKNEPLLSQWMDGQDWHWFRLPFLAEGDTPEKKAAIRTFLLQHGYKIAGVTMSFGDYRWNEPYARCRGMRKLFELLPQCTVLLSHKRILFPLRSQRRENARAPVERSISRSRPTSQAR
jgi:peptidoglycan/xylan/chitin deacetylase (PgdA/CDA1 family)